MNNFPQEQIQSKIYNIRDKKVMLDSDIARFDDDFMFHCASSEGLIKEIKLEEQISLLD
jgi:hypothetical protein